MFPEPKKVILPNQFWTSRDVEILAERPTIANLLGVALRILDRMILRNPEKKITLVSGPISTGGLGSLKANTVRFRAAIMALEAHGYLVFDQLPFQQAMDRLVAERLSKNPTEYPHFLIDQFYEPIIRSGKIDQLMLVLGWSDSTGACREVALAESAGLQIEDIPTEWLMIREALLNSRKLRGRQAPAA